MMPVIRIGEETWERLKKWAEPLVDTPDDALRKVLDAADGHLMRSKVASPKVDEVQSSAHFSDEKPQRGKKIPQQAFNDPILESLYELGGRGHTSEVLARVGHKMKHLLGDYDHQALPSGDIRWQKTANWARYWLTKRGFLKAESERGVWELTEQGKKASASKKS